MTKFTTLHDALADAFRVLLEKEDSLLQARIWLLGRILANSVIQSLTDKEKLGEIEWCCGIEGFPSSGLGSTPAEAVMISLRRIVHTLNAVESEDHIKFLTQKLNLAEAKQRRH